MGFERCNGDMQLNYTEYIIISYMLSTIIILLYIMLLNIIILYYNTCNFNTKTRINIFNDMKWSKKIKLYFIS